MANFKDCEEKLDLVSLKGQRGGGGFTAVVLDSNGVFLLLILKEPWIQHGTVKENILFGKAFDVEKYSAVIYACALSEVRIIQLCFLLGALNELLWLQ